jgi:hypothetical protein
MSPPSTSIRLLLYGTPGEFSVLTLLNSRAPNSNVTNTDFVQQKASESLMSSAARSWDDPAAHLLFAQVSQAMYATDLTMGLVSFIEL